MLVYQIELSNVCSLTCGYCPHPTQSRTRGFMDDDTFAKCVELYTRSDNVGPLYLHNFGEVTLHPRLPELLELARSRGVECSFYTNGMATRTTPQTREYWERLAAAGLRSVDFSSHALPVEEFRAIVDGVVEVKKTFDPQVRKLGTWAGQTGPKEEPVPEPCLFERDNAVVILWDGRVSVCCFDVEGRRQGLTVDDLLRTGTYEFAPIPLCGGCGSMRHVEVI